MSLLGDGGFLVQALANPYGLPSQGEWNLQRGAFTTNGTPPQTVVFFVETRKGQNPSQLTAIDQISDTGGRRIAVYEYPYKDGQALADLGRKGEKFSMNIKFMGLNYQEIFQQFLDVCVNSNQSGTLSHPVRGNIPCKYADHEIVHRYDEWNAVTIKATFMEDNTGAILSTNLRPASQNSALRSALQTLTNIESSISAGISAVSAVLLLPAAIENAMQLRITSIKDQVSQLLGQLAVTFSTDAQAKSLMANAAAVSGGVTSLNSGITSSGTALPPVFQVGFSPSDQASINAQTAAYVSANQVTPQAAVFAANQARSAISAAIAEVLANTGNQGFDIMVSYRQLAVQIQQVTQSCIASAVPSVKAYVLPSTMSLRKVATNNGLTPDQQNTIESLNPYLASVNFLPAGTVVLVPAA